MDPSVIADAPDEKSARPASPPLPTIGAYPLSERDFHAFRIFAAPPFSSNATAVAAASLPLPLFA